MNNDSIILLYEYIGMGIRPDAQSGHGYGRLGKTGPAGQTTKLNTQYPYREPVDPYDDDDVDSPIDDDDINQLMAKINKQYRYPDDTNRRIADKQAFVNGNMRLTMGAEYDNKNQLAEDVFVLRPKSSKHVPGTLRGWAGAPPPTLAGEENDEPVYNLRDIIKRILQKILKKR